MTVVGKMISFTFAPTIRQLLAVLADMGDYNVDITVRNTADIFQRDVRK
jgi:hypothetical protein